MLFMQLCIIHTHTHAMMMMMRSNKNELILKFHFLFLPVLLHTQAYLIQLQAQKILKIAPVFACMRWQP